MTTSCNGCSTPTTSCSTPTGPTRASTAPPRPSGTAPATRPSRRPARCPRRRPTPPGTSGPAAGVDLGNRFSVYLGHQWTGAAVTVVRDDLDVAILHDGRLDKQLTIDP